MSCKGAVLCTYIHYIYIYSAWVTVVVFVHDSNLLMTNRRMNTTPTIPLLQAVSVHRCPWNCNDSSTRLTVCVTLIYFFIIIIITIVVHCWLTKWLIAYNFERHRDSIDAYSAFLKIGLTWPFFLCGCEIGLTYASV